MIWIIRSHNNKESSLILFMDYHKLKHVDLTTSPSHTAKIVASKQNRKDYFDIL